MSHGSLLQTSGHFTWKPQSAEPQSEFCVVVLGLKLMDHGLDWATREVNIIIFRSMVVDLW